MAAVLAAGDGAALSHLSAASLWLMWRGREGETDVVSQTSRQGASGVRYHFTRRLDRGDVRTRNGIPVTSVERTLVDLADVLELHQLARAIHEAAFRYRLSISKLRETIGRLRGRPRLHVVEEALELFLSGSAGTKSRPEDRFLAWFMHDKPRVNTHVHGIEVDFLWPDATLVVEVDGPGHWRPTTRTQDATRDHTLRANGYDVMRVTDREVEHHGARVRDRILEQLALRRATPPQAPPA